MAKSLQVAGLILLGAALGFAEQAAKGAAKAAGPGDPVGLRPNLLKGGAPMGGVPKGAPKGGPRLTNPASPAARLFRATPEQRERVFEKLPLAQQERMRKELEWFDSLPKDQQEIVIRRSERLAALPPEKQRAVQQQMQALNRLAPERTRAVRLALLRLQGMPDERRHEAVSSEQFRSRFSAEEWQIISDLAAVMLPPR